MRSNYLVTALVPMTWNNNCIFFKNTKVLVGKSLFFYVANILEMSNPNKWTKDLNM